MQQHVAQSEEKRQCKVPYPRPPGPPQVNIQSSSSDASSARLRGLERITDSLGSPILGVRVIAGVVTRRPVLAESGVLLELLHLALLRLAPGLLHLAPGDREPPEDLEKYLALRREQQSREKRGRNDAGSSKLIRDDKPDDSPPPKMGKFPKM